MRADLLQFIKLIRDSFGHADQVYNNGSCVRFAIILQNQYPGGAVYYNGDHAYYVLDTFAYDIHGCYPKQQIDIGKPLVDYSLLELQEILNLRYE